MFKWVEPKHCGDRIDGYFIQTSDNHSHKVTTTTNATSVNATGLRKGVQYNVSVYGSINGLNGEKANLLLTLDGMFVINSITIMLYNYLVPEKVFNLTVTSSLRNIMLLWQVYTCSPL